MRGGGDKSRKIFVGGLPNSADEDTLKMAFSRYGKVTSFLASTAYRVLGQLSADQMTVGGLLINFCLTSLATRQLANSLTLLQVTEQSHCHMQEKLNYKYGIFLKEFLFIHTLSLKKNVQNLFRKCAWWLSFQMWCVFSSLSSQYSPVAISIFHCFWNAPLVECSWIGWTWREKRIITASDIRRRINTVCVFFLDRLQKWWSCMISRGRDLEVM